MTKFRGMTYTKSGGKITYIFEGLLRGRENKLQVPRKWISV